MLIPSMANAYNFTVDGITYATQTSKPTCVTVTSADAGITSLSLPSSVEWNNETYTVTEISYSAFRNNTILTDIIIPASITSIGKAAFRYCTSLNKVVFEDGNNPLYIGYCWAYDGESDIAEGAHAFYYCPLREVYIGRDITYGQDNSMGWSPFANKTALKSVTIGEGVTTLNPYFFHYCTSIKTLNIPSTLTNIDRTNFREDGFVTCTSLNEFNVSPNNPNYSSIDGVLYDKDQKTLLLMLQRDWTSFEIPSTVENIASEAFICCQKLTHLTISPNLKNAGYSGFERCAGLQSIIYNTENPINVEGGYWDDYDRFHDIFSSLTYQNATLYVNPAGIERVKTLNPWKKFENIKPIAPEGPEASFSMADATMRMGETLTLPVSMSNSVDITSFQCDIHLSEGFEAVKNAKGKPQVKLSARKSATHTISANVMPDGVVRVACLSLDNSPFSEAEGALFTIDIQPVNAEAGIHEITIDNILAGKPDGKGVNIEPTKCSITLRKALMPGDVNDDDVVNVSDAIATVNYILGDASAGYLLENADLNGDGIINILDATEIIKIVLGTNSASQTPAIVKASAKNEVNSTEQEALYVDNFEIKSGEEKLLPIKLKANRAYTGFQTDIYLPEGVEVVTITKGNTTTPDVELNEECNSGTHIISSAIQKDGALRVISISLENDMYGQSIDNTLFTVRVRVKPEFKSSGISPIYFRKTLFNTGKEESHFADSSSEIGINNTTTSVVDILEENSCKQYFNLQGMPVQTPVKGLMYILKTTTSAEKVVY